MVNQNPNVEDEIFSKSEIEYYKSRGLSDEQIRTLKEAEGLCQLADMLPEDTNEVFDKVESLPDDPAEEIKALDRMMEEDPESFAKIMAVAEAVDQVIESNSPSN